MDIQALYKAILESLGLTADNDGLLMMQYADQTFPVLVEGKRLSLPTPERLRSGDWEGTIAFHPLSENLLRGESPVLKKIKGIMTLRLHSVIMDLLQQFVALGADTARHKTLSPRAQELLSHIPEVDEKSFQAMQKLLDEASPDGPYRLVSVYLKRGGMFKGVKYSRLAVISFPYLEAFDTDDSTVFGVKLRKKDFAAFKSLFEYILPGSEDLETYSVGSQSMIAPYFDAIIHAYLKVAKQLNSVIKLHRKQLENPDALEFSLDWEDAVENLAQYQGLIPQLAGNDGELIGSGETAAATSKPLPSVVVPRQQAAPVAHPIPIAPTPATAAAAIPSLPEGQRSPFNTDFAAKPVPVAPTAPCTTSVGSLDPAGVKHTKGGVDFNTLMQARQRASGHVPVSPMMVATQGWVGQPAMMPVGSGGYAGYDRGRPITQFTGGTFGMGYGMMPAPMPDWVNTPRPGVNTGFATAPTFPGGGYGAQAWPAAGSSV